MRGDLAGVAGGAQQKRHALIGLEIGKAGTGTLAFDGAVFGVSAVKVAKAARLTKPASDG